MSKKPHGFTIVELVVVIVVIAILAAIAVVSYRSTQQQARNTAISSNVQSWLKLLDVMYTRQGQVTVTLDSGYNAICLGSKSQYPAISGGLGEGECYINSHTSDELEAIIAKIGSAGMDTYVSNGSGLDFRGIQYGFDTEAGVSTVSPIIWFNLAGADQDCASYVPDSEISMYNSAGDAATGCFVNVKEKYGGTPIEILEP